MSLRELLVLGTASQVPTRHRNHNGYLLRWDGEGILFDPGEGTQRQFTLAGTPMSSVTRICLTHLHGDHCLGLPGVVQRLSLDQVRHPVDLYFPASGTPYVERLLAATIHHCDVEVRLHPTDGAGTYDLGNLRLVSEPLDHSVDTLGWRVAEPPGRRMRPELLARHGISGPDVGRLQRDGTLATGTGTVRVEDVSAPKPGTRVAIVMDTAYCPAAVELARRADLLLCEATYLSEHAALAASHRHLTAADAGRIAAQAGARRLVLTHFSQRYTDTVAFGEQARRHFPDVVVAEDLARIPVP